MKKNFILPISFFLLFIFTIIISTTIDSSKEQEDIRSSLLLKQAKQDSVKYAIDSIAKIEGNKIIGNINFGINERAYKKQINDFINFLKDSEGKARLGNFIVKAERYTSHWDGSKIYDGRYIYDNAAFYQDSLFNLKLKSEGFNIYEHSSGSYFDNNDNINGMVESLIKIFTEKYGEPILDTRGYYSKSIDIDWRTKESRTIWTLAKWEIGHKIVEIGVWIERRNIDQATVFLSFTNSETVLKINLKSEEEKAIKDSIKKHENMINQEKIKSL